MFKKFIVKIKASLQNTRGEGYIDVIVIIMATILVIALAVNLFPAYITKQKVDTFATEILRVAEIAGRVGTETTAKQAQLVAQTGINPTVTWSRTGAVQLNGEISVTVAMTVDIGLFGNIASFPINLTGKATGKM